MSYLWIILLVPHALLDPLCLDAHAITYTVALRDAAERQSNQRWTIYRSHTCTDVPSAQAWTLLRIVQHESCAYGSLKPPNVTCKWDQHTELGSGGSTNSLRDPRAVKQFTPSKL